MKNIQFSQRTVSLSNFDRSLLPKNIVTQDKNIPFEYSFEDILSTIQTLYGRN